MARVEVEGRVFGVAFATGDGRQESGGRRGRSVGEEHGRRAALGGLQQIVASRRIGHQTGQHPALELEQVRTAETLDQCHEIDEPERVSPQTETENDLKEIDGQDGDGQPFSDPPRLRLQVVLQSFGVVEFDVEEIRPSWTLSVEIVDETTRDGQEVIERDGVIFQYEDVVGRATGVQTKNVIFFFLVH